LNPEFLDVEDILEMHAGQLTEHGGLNGVRDMNLLDSAVAQPMAQFGGQFLNGDLFEMAAALHISLVLNHPFLDGNKRTALLAALTFLDLNGLPIERPNQLLEDVTRQVAEGTMSKESLASVFRGLIAVDPGPEAMT
jgi:death on curing protein